MSLDTMLLAVLSLTAFYFAVVVLYYNHNLPK